MMQYIKYNHSEYYKYLVYISSRSLEYILIKKKYFEEEDPLLHVDQNIAMGYEFAYDNNSGKMIEIEKNGITYLLMTRPRTL